MSFYYLAYYMQKQFIKKVAPKPPAPPVPPQAPPVQLPSSDKDKEDYTLTPSSLHQWPLLP